MQQMDRTDITLHKEARHKEHMPFQGTYMRCKTSRTIGNLVREVYWPREGLQGPSQVLEMLYVLIWVVVTQVYTYIKLHGAVY